MGITAKISIPVEKLLLWVFRRRLVVWTALGVLLALMVFSAAQFGNYSNDLGQLFPLNSISGNMYRVMEESHLGDSVQLEIDSGQPGGALELLQPVEELAARLAAIPEIEAVDFKISADFHSAMAELTPVLPLLLDASILKQADPQQAARNARKALLLPAAPISALRLDPFGWNGQFLQQLQSFQQLAGMKISLRHPFMTDDTAARLLLNLQIRLGQPANAQRSAKLFQQIRAEAAALLPSAKLSIISPLAHTLENELTVRRDILKISLTSMLALLLLFFIIYRGAVDAIWIPLLPFAASIIVTGLLAMIFQNICLVILGICGSIAGLAVDQGIHIYTAFAGRARFRKLSGLALPLAMSAITSAAVFLTLGFSGIYAYLQLGIFAGCTLLVNLLLSFFILPTLLNRRRELHFSFANFKPRIRTAWVIVSIWLLFCLGSAILLPKLQFDFNLSALDGTSQETIQAEKDFQQRWRTAEAGNMIVVTGSDQQQILATCEKLEREIFPLGRCFHPASLWPARQKQSANLQTWCHPDLDEQLREMQNALSRECQKVGLPAAFYTLFFESLRSGINAGMKMPEPQIFQAVTGKLLRQRQDSATGLFFFAERLDTSELIALLRKLDTFGNCALLSNESFRQAISDDIRPILARVLLLAAIAVLLLLLPIYRSFGNLGIIIIPGFTATLWFAGLAAASGTAVNIASCFGMIILIGLVIDYGIFSLHHFSANNHSTISTAIFLSAITTLFTSGALLFSRHPVLLHTGLVLFCEILFAALTALYVVPALMIVLRKKKAAISVLASICLAGTAVGCRTIPPEAYPTRQLTQSEATQEWQTFQAAHNKAGTHLLTLKVEILWYSFPMILALQKEPATRHLSATGMLPSGARLFSVTGNNGQETSKNISEVFPEIAQKKIFASIYQDFCDIFFTGPQDWLFPAVSTTPFQRHLPTGEQQFLAGEPLRVVQKRLGRFPNRKWIVYYSGWNADLQAFEIAEYKNYSTGCKFTFRLSPQP